MNDSEYQALIEESWHRPLTADEASRLDAWLAANPAVRTDWETDAALTRELQRLPNAPMASNFTAQVMVSVERELREAARRPSPLERFSRWLRRPASRLAWAVLLIAAGLFGYQQHRANVREEMAKGLSLLASMATLSDPAVFEDFEAIRSLGQAAPTDDEELYAVLIQ
jgi:anti-sigma factor RsiW